MTPEQAAALEAAVARTPDDRESREKLLAYYADHRRQLDPAALSARRAHILWMIEHHPDFAIASLSSLRLYTMGWGHLASRTPSSDVSRQSRPEGLRAGKATLADGDGQARRFRADPD